MSPSIAMSMLYCGAAFGGSFLFMRLAAPDMPPAVVAFLRVGVAALILLAVGGPKVARALLADWRRFAVLGVFMTGGPFLLFAAAEQSITAGLGAVINATTPMWTALVAAVWIGQPLTRARIVAIVLGFAGVAVIVGVDGLRIGADAWVGVALAIVAASSYAIGLSFIRRNMTAYDPLTLSFGQLAAAAVMLLPVAGLTAGEATPTPVSIAAVLGIATLSTAIAVPLLFRVNRRVGPVATSTVTFLSPIFGVIWGALFLAEPITPTLFAGGALILVSLALILDLVPRRPLRPVAAEPARP